MALCDHPRIADLDERPAAELTEVVDRRHPEGPRRLAFRLLEVEILSGDLDDQVEQVVLAATIVESDDQIRDVVVRGAIERVGDGEPEVIVLHVGAHFAHFFKTLGDRVLPAAVGDDVGDVAELGARRHDLFRGVEVNISCRPDAVVRGEPGKQSPVHRCRRGRSPR